MEQRVNYFQSKCMRNILKVEAACYSKVSNREILDRASMLIHGELGKMRVFN